MEVKVIDSKGKATSKKVTLSETIFGIEPNDHAIYLDVKQHLANRRQGTHKSKERNEVAGSTRKIKKQKGTGTARAGSIKSPVFRGGGRIFGPRPRDYGFKLNKKVKKLARKSALTYKAKDDKIVIVEDFSLAAPKTKEYLQILNNLSLNNTKSLVVLADHNQNIYLSSRNLQNTKVVTAQQLNTHDILNANHLVLSEGAVAQIESVLN